MTTINNKLRLSHLHELYSLTLYCAQSRIDFLAQSHYPADTASLMATFDMTLLDLTNSAMGATGQSVMTDPFALRRLRLPARLKGGAIRERQDLAPAAFMGACCAVLPTMIKRMVGGVELPGFAPSLEGILGAGSFDQGNEKHRFAALAGSGSRLGAAFVSSWGALRAEAVAATLTLQRDLEGPLAASVEAAGTLDGEVIRKMQGALTEQRETLRRDIFDQDVRRLLPLTDPRRISWECADRFSTQFISAPPLHGLEINNADWQEILAAYYGMPSPACVRHAGTRIFGTGPLLDAHGVKALSYTPLVNRNGIRTRWHDTILEGVHRSFKEGGVDVDTEASYLFAHCAGPRRAEMLRSTERNNNCIIPDMTFVGPARVRRIAEFKTVSLCPTRYHSTMIARGRSPVDCRADALQGEYGAHAIKLDGKWNSVHDGTGPFVARLKDFGPVIGVVFGNFGEGSKGAAHLLDFAAQAIANSSWMDMGARDSDDALASSRLRLYRQWGIRAARARACALQQAIAVALQRGTSSAPSAARRSRAFHDQSNHYAASTTGGLHHHNSKYA
jgi:hypothetical protein